MPSGSSASAVFTSSGKTGDVTVNLVSGGQTVGSAVLHVQNPDRLAFASDEVNLNYKDVSDLGFKATYQTETVHLRPRRRKLQRQPVHRYRQCEVFRQSHRHRRAGRPDGLRHREHRHGAHHDH